MLVLKRSFGKENAFLTSIGLSGNKSDAEYKGPKMRVVGGLFGPWSYVKWLSSWGPCWLTLYNNKINQCQKTQNSKSGVGVTGVKWKLISKDHIFDITNLIEVFIFIFLKLFKRRKFNRVFKKFNRVDH